MPVSKIGKRVDKISQSQGKTPRSIGVANFTQIVEKLSDRKLGLRHEGLVDAINKGGVALQEVLSANLVCEGQMLRRERSFEGIEVNYITLDAEGAAKYSVKDKEQEHRAVVDNITEVLRGIIRFQSYHILPQIKLQDKALKMEMTNAEQRKGTQELGVSASPFFSKVI